MISVAGYNSGGDLTATRVNAGSFAINSTNINTLFAPIASPSFTGNATVSGTLTTSNDVVINTGATGVRYGRVMSHDQYHAMILRGDINYSAPNYTVTGGQDATTFVQFGGTYRFRQVTNSLNALVFEITPTHVNVGNSLRIGGVSTDTLYMARPWVQCIVNQTASLLAGSDTGRVTPTIARTSGQAVGAYDISFSSHPRSFNYTYCVQVRVDTGLAFAVVSNVFSNSVKVRTYNASQALADLQFSITIFS